jgi:hypothetical protein
MFARMAIGLAVVLGAMMAGCGGGAGGGGITPSAACEEAQTNLCERLYTCYTPAELALIGFPSAEAACVTKLVEAEGCAKQTVANVCVGNERYHPDQAERCVEQVTGLACSQVRDDNLVLEVAAPACGKVCVVD